MEFIVIRHFCLAPMTMADGTAAVLEVYRRPAKPLCRRSILFKTFPHPALKRFKPVPRLQQKPMPTAFLP
jgi:hypothetical protein